MSGEMREERKAATACSLDDLLRVDPSPRERDGTREDAARCSAGAVSGRMVDVVAALRPGTVKDLAGDGDPRRLRRASATHGHPR